MQLTNSSYLSCLWNCLISKDFLQKYLKVHVMTQKKNLFESFQFEKIKFRDIIC